MIHLIDDDVSQAHHLFHLSLVMETSGDFVVFLHKRRTCLVTMVQMKTVITTTKGPPIIIIVV